MCKMEIQGTHLNYSHQFFHNLHISHEFAVATRVVGKFRVGFRNRCIDWMDSDQNDQRNTFMFDRFKG